MNITPYVDRLRNALLDGAVGDEAVDVAERLVARLEPAVRLMLLDVMSAAADEITCDLAPGSVEVRLRGGDPTFVVTPPPTDHPDATHDATPLPPASDDDDGPTARINLRLPEQLKVGVEEAANRERLSNNAWLVRLIAAAVAPAGPPGAARSRGGRVGESWSGWVR